VAVVDATHHRVQDRRHEEAHTDANEQQGRKKPCGRKRIDCPAQDERKKHPDQVHEDACHHDTAHPERRKPTCNRRNDSERPVEYCQAATEVARAFIDMWRTILEKSNFGAGCGVVAVTVAADTPALLDKAAEVFRSRRSSLAKLLAEGGVPTKRADSSAVSLIAACKGAVVLSRAERSFEPFDLVAAEQLATIKIAMKKK
jgi:hypothetical protein